ncbi:type IV secretory system conjugative DNA transfer family protein [Agromyces aurantiacus]|uniref:Type IV secretory system conjugative DNA transfer family protein n=1 Tax=Agromyces aurantiacus TaxID=165814 RepID=A0ABV9R472_9MICO|nr:hypothetical protein [Agromyces aurantiacus]MBM7502927.1 energy-coupling factor transporter ATP-binding protein EcfA2 [Agromyces aurantiacus]
MPEVIVRTQLHLPRPLDAENLSALIGRLMGADIPRPFALEVYAGADGTSAVLACASTAVQRLKRLLRGYVPAAQFQAAVGPDVASVSRVVARPGGLPLAEIDPELLVAALLQALAAPRGDERLAMQIVFGRAHRRRQLNSPGADPFQPLAGRLLDGVRPASPETQRRMRTHWAEPRLDATVRLGVTADSVKRRHALIWELFGALQPIEAPGVHLSLVRDTPTRWQHAVPKDSGLQLTSSEILPLLAWPLGDRDYPGVPPLHPRLLPVPEIVSRTKSVFATGTAPGPARPIGIDPQSRLQHLVAIGPTGSGKSTLLEHLILSDIHAKRACCVIEPKAQLIDRILDIAPASAAGQIMILDATDEAAPVGFNPLDVGDRDPDIVVDGILAALAAVFQEGWGPRTEYLIQGALLSLARAGQTRAEPYTLIDLPRLLTDVAFRRPVIAAVQSDPTLAAFWADFEAMRPGQRAAVIAAPLNKLRKIVMRKPLVRVLGQSRPRFRIRDIFRDRKTVLVPLNDALLGAGASKLLGSLVVAELFLAATERAAEKDPMKRPGFVYVDEVQNYLHLPTSVGDAMSVFRSYGVGLHVAHQYREQLPPGMRAGFDVNARSKICFTLLPDDARDMARQAPGLTANDFQTLPKYHIYAHLLAGGTPAGWCSAVTLPPPPTVGAAEAIRATSRDLYGALPLLAEAHVGASVEAAEPAATQGRGAHQKARRP